MMMHSPGRLLFHVLNRGIDLLLLIAGLLFCLTSIVVQVDVLLLLLPVLHFSFPHAYGADLQ